MDICRNWSTCLSFPVISGTDLIKILVKIGFKEVRQKGSHVSLQKKSDNKFYRTVVPLHKELAKGTLRDILNLSKENLIKLL